MRQTPDDEPLRRWRLFALSFISLFLELLLIRWTPSVVRLIAYYGNLMLLSSFLGLGMGSMIAGRRPRLLAWFPVLLAIEIFTVQLSRHIALPGGSDEARFYATTAPHLLNYLVLACIFAANAFAFLPLGQEIGRLFQSLPPLAAYTWDLCGSLLGTIVFGLFSFNCFSPVLGMVAVCVVFTLLSARNDLWLAAPAFAVLLSVLYVTADPSSRWSPYYYVTVRTAAVIDNSTLAKSPLVTSPPSDVRTMKDPPMYAVAVNQDFYQFHGTIDLSRYNADSEASKLPRMLRDQYLLPYLVCPGRKRVAILGAGGGLDVEAALLSGAQHVDAAEIDPQLVSLAKVFSASGVYDDPRVSVHVDDARAFLGRAEPNYDLVVFGYLDSQALFSYMSHVRLDGFVYTTESLRAAYSLLNDNGAMVLSFGAPRPWVADKLLRMVIEATGRAPIIFADFKGHGVIFISPRGPYYTNPPDRWGKFVRIPSSSQASAIEPATDDWPYLYLREHAVPSDYLLMIALLLALSLGAIVAIRGAQVDLNSSHFAFLGMGFLLLETKAIMDSSLYFGATWLVTMIVVSGVLLMILAANLVASRIQRFSLLLYVPLLTTLAVQYAFPRDSILMFGFVGRLVWTMLAVPLPIFFAGLIFSTTFRDGGNPSLLFGANLIGAMLGGFTEYLSMAIGSRSLTLIVVVAYLGSLLCQARLTKRTAIVTSASRLFAG